MIITNFKIYLAGACKNVSEFELSMWRKIAKKYFDNFNQMSSDCKVKTINPNDYFNYQENLHKTQKQIKDFFMYQVRTSDVVLVNLNYSNGSVGTAQELQHAVDNNIPVIGFGTKEVYPWESECDCQVVFDTLEKALEYIKDYYLL